MAPSSPPASDQTLDHPPLPSSSPDLHHTPELSETHTSNMSSAQEGSAPIAGASALEITKPTQAGFPFLSLPPEIRNMIYHYVFTPVRDGTCWAVYISYDYSHLKGFHKECRYCFSESEHTICHPDIKILQNYRFVFEINDNYTHSGILQTCHSIFKEAMPISLAHMHISLDSLYFYNTPFKPLELFLANMRQPQGAYFEKLTYICYESRTIPGVSQDLASFINHKNIRLGRLDLIALSGSPTQPRREGALRHFVSIVDTLKNLPPSVKWIVGSVQWPTDLEKHRFDFNDAVETWREKLATIRLADSDTPAPLLRDFLPQYFDQSSD